MMKNFMNLWPLIRKKNLLNFDTPLMNIEKTPKLPKTYFKEIVLVYRKYLEKWIGFVTLSETSSKKFE